MSQQYGALPREWDHLSTTLGLTEDLLPVVSNPLAEISPESKMKDIGKTPSVYNSHHHVMGIGKWTQKHSNAGDIKKWSKEKDYGICIQTRRVRAFDIDISDADQAQSVIESISGTLHWLGLPMRIRSNSTKCLLIFEYTGELHKRIIRTEHGIVELLATGQQFIACGTHTSGVKYEWPDGLPTEIPSLTIEEIEEVWSEIEKNYAVAPSSNSAAPTKAKKLSEAFVNDPVAKYLIDNNWVKSTERDGRLHITCPFEAEHTGASADSATTYFPANTGGYQHGHFDCKHAHCEGRSDADFKEGVGVNYENGFEDFDDLAASGIPDGNVRDGTDSATGEGGKEVPNKYKVIPAGEFSQGKPASWIVKGVLPRADVIVVFGESGSGKSFWVLDIAGCVVRGLPWRDRRVKKGKAVYVCAEGASGFRNRLRAYADNNNIDLSDFDIGVIPDAPNLLQVSDVKALIHAIKAFGEVSLVIIDTLAQVVPGANENTGEDMGKALSHCKQIRKHTGGTVLLVHHSGKDSSKGARGWSGVRAAADAEIEIVRIDGTNRAALITKQKDGVDGGEFGFKLQIVPVGIDDDDDVITSCIVQPVEGTLPLRLKQAALKARTGANELMAMNVLRTMLAEEKTSTVKYTELLKACTEQVERGNGKRDRRRESAMRALDALRHEGLITVNGTDIGLPDYVDDGADLC